MAAVVVLKMQLSVSQSNSPVKDGSGGGVTVLGGLLLLLFELDCAAVVSVVVIVVSDVDVFWLLNSSGFDVNPEFVLVGSELIAKQSYFKLLYFVRLNLSSINNKYLVEATTRQCVKST
jgi:hypothetical protein